MKHLLRKFIGGIHVPQHKQESLRLPVTSPAIPNELVLPLHQHIGSEAIPVVAVGEHVLKGQRIARAPDYVSAPIHAPTSGEIVSIGMMAVPHPSGMSGNCIVIKSDGKDEWCELRPHSEDFRHLDPSELRNLIREAGIVGLGGAGFPSYIKLNPGPKGKVETVILNGAECEPYITCDDKLMQDRPEEIVAGLLIIRHALQAEKCVIAIEDNKPEAFAALDAAVKRLAQPELRVMQIPTIYPAGSEKQLIHTVTGKQVPSDGLPIHVGVVCQNVGTAAAIYRAVHHGEPLISRYITITGDVNIPINLEVLIGTSVVELVRHAGNYKSVPKRIIMGGPMMGFALQSDSLPAIKTTNCILVDNGENESLYQRKEILPCIRCGQCADVCPIQLLPQQMYWHSRATEFEKLQEYNLFDCIECGCCDYVCPSQIPLVQYYRFAKAEIWLREREKEKSNIARERHEFRQFRIEREKQERAEKHKKRMSALKQENEVVDKKKEDPKKAAIVAAMERVKAKKAAQVVELKNTANLTPEQKQKIAEVDARRVQQRAELEEKHKADSLASSFDEENRKEADK